MITHDDLKHHLRREREERRKASDTKNPEAKLVHQQLADSHGRRAARAREILNTIELSLSFRPQF